MNRLRSVLIVAASALACSGAALANNCASPSRDGDANISGSVVLNTYYPSNTTTLSAGATSISIGSATGTTPISAGDLLLIVQIQGASANPANSSAYGANNGTGRGYTALATAGNYEYVRAANSVPLSGGTVTLSTAITGSYANGAASTTTTGTVGRRRYQVIRVPQYRSMALSGTINAAQWNGSTGGVIAIDVSGNLALTGGTFSATGRGFRGGGALSSSTGSGANTDFATSHAAAANNGAKGEGIVGTPARIFDGSSYSSTAAADIPAGRGAARGAAGNAGGGGTDGSPIDNQQNSGGGGGGNGGAGGQGGHSWCPAASTTSCPRSGGLGGVAVPDGGQSALVMGGGGGAGTTNNASGNLTNGAGSSGGNGGGAILVRVGSATGSGSMEANGTSLSAAVTNDGSGGGGAGGTIQFLAGTSSASILASATGAPGSSNTGGGSPHGPGGGGGGGVIVSNILLSTNVSGGAAGTTTNDVNFGAAYGATAGTAGVVVSTLPRSGVPGYSSGSECTPDVSKSFSPTTITAGSTTRLTITLSNPNATNSIAGLSASDPLPSGTSVAPAPSPATTCTGGSVSATPGAASVSLSGASLAAGSSCTVSVNVTSSTIGDQTNVIPAGGVTGTFSGPATSSSNPEAATASYTVTQGLSISKQVTVFFDPITGLSPSAKAIPGSIVQYSLTVSNPSGVPIDANSVVLTDVIPQNTTLIVSPYYQAIGYPNARGPFQFNDGQDGSGAQGTASGLTFLYQSLASTTDTPSFSSNGTTFDYTPSGNTSDPQVRAVRFSMLGTMAPSSRFTVNFLVLVN